MSTLASSIARMRHLQAIPVHYDMGDRYGNDADGDGRIEFDCSSAVSYALEISLNNNTETLQQALPAIGYAKIFDAVDGTFDAKYGDVVIWAPRDGSSSLGSFGHVLIMTSDTTTISGISTVVLVRSYSVRAGHHSQRQHKANLTVN